MMLPIPAALSLFGVDNSAAARAIASLGIYMGIYLFMNLGAFAIVGFLRNALGSENIADYAGLIHRAPMVVVCMGCILFSLVGIPPLAGFVGKFAIFASLAEGYGTTGEVYLLLLLIIGGINTAVSLFYYLRVIKVMAIDPEPDRPADMQWSMISSAGAYIVVITLPLLLLFVKWTALSEIAMGAAKQLF
jgi:NADH-quinone oxidoreductase subunit N